MTILNIFTHGKYLEINWFLKTRIKNLGWTNKITFIFLTYIKVPYRVIYYIIYIYVITITYILYFQWLLLDSAFLTMTSLCPCRSIGSSSIGWGTIVWCGVIKIKERDRVIRYNGPLKYTGCTWWKERHHSSIFELRNGSRVFRLPRWTIQPINVVLYLIRKNIYVHHYIIRNYIIILNIKRIKIEF